MYPLLLAIGIGDAKRVAAALSSLIEIDCVASSDLRRSISTADILHTRFPHAKRLIIPELREMRQEFLFLINSLCI